MLGIVTDKRKLVCGVQVDRVLETFTLYLISKEIDVSPVAIQAFKFSKQTLSEVRHTLLGNVSV
jgi:hypothetical protein